VIHRPRRRFGGLAATLPSVAGMRTRRSSAEHQEAVARRLEQLSADVAASRADPAVAPAAGGDWWAGHTRVAEPRPALEVVVDQPEPAQALLPPVVPVPGRHAARRRGSLTLLPDTLRGRVALGPAQLAVVAVLVALGLAVTAWWVIRADPGQPAAPPAVPGTPADGLVSMAPEAAPSATPAGVGGGRITVDVAGEVRRPGIAVLDAGSRVVDAIKAAGGARKGVDLSSLNLARELVDGEQVLVGAPAAPVAPGPAGVPAPGVPSASGPLVNLNLATQAELETLPEVGPVTAQAILAWRDQHGGFTAVAELLEVDGIGDATLAQITPYVTI
jgi:competence protein ComEA